MSHAIRFTNVSKQHAGHGVLSALDLEVPRGSLFGLAGINGAGKTTLLRCLLDFCALDSGSIHIFGASHLLPASRQALAFLPEQFMPVPHLTGDEFLQYVVKLLGQRYNRAEAAHMLQTLDLEESALKRTVRLYSKGMTQKLGLAATFLIRKELYVLDEPTSGLDPRARVRLKERLLALRGEGATVLLTSHALADIDELCDQMAILHGGRLAFAGSPAACRAHFGTDSLEAAFMTATSQCTSPISA
jgi:ABC-2 type transport system ATP-binding protein